jgi:hypothetical protein
VKLIGETIVAMEKQEIFNILAVCLSLVYPACKAIHPNYVVISGFPGCTSFFHVGTFFGKMLLNVKRVF